MANDLSALTHTRIEQCVEFNIDGEQDFKVDELTSSVEDFVDYLQKLPWSGRLHITMRFEGGQPLRLRVR